MHDATRLEALSFAAAVADFGAYTLRRLLCDACRFYEAEAATWVNFDAA